MALKRPTGQREQSKSGLILAGLGAAIAGLFLLGKKGGAQQTVLEAVGDPVIS